MAKTRTIKLVVSQRNARNIIEKGEVPSDLMEKLRKTLMDEVKTKFPEEKQNKDDAVRAWTLLNTPEVIGKVRQLVDDAIPAYCEAAKKRRASSMEMDSVIGGAREKISQLVEGILTDNGITTLEYRHDNMLVVKNAFVQSPHKYGSPYREQFENPDRERYLPNTWMDFDEAARKDAEAERAAARAESGENPASK